MSCLLEFDEIECQDFGGSVPGVSFILAVERKKLGWWYYLETHPYQYGEIIGNELSPTWYIISAKQDQTSFEQDQTNDVRRLYNQKLNINFNGISKYYRDKLEKIVVLEDLVIIFRDKNKRYWCMGETSGSQVQAWNFGTGISKSGSNDTTLDINALERYPIREVDPNYIDIIVTCAYPLCGHSLDDLCLDGESLDSLCSKCAKLN